MSYYGPIEARLQTLLQAATDIFADPSQVTRSDWSVLDSGRSPLAVLHPGPFDTAGTAATAGDTYHWEVKLDLFVRYTNDPETHATFISVRDALLAYLQKYPTLNRMPNINKMSVVAGGDPAPVKEVNGSGPFFLFSQLSIKVNEIIFADSLE